MKFLKMFFYYLFILHFKKYIWPMSPLFFLLGVYAYASQNLQGRQNAEMPFMVLCFFQIQQTV